MYQPEQPYITCVVPGRGFEKKEENTSSVHCRAGDAVWTGQSITSWVIIAMVQMESRQKEGN